MKGPTDTSNFDDFEETEPWVPHFNKSKGGKNKAKQDMRFVGFTFKKMDDDSKMKNIVSLFDEIEQARDKKKLNLKIDDVETIAANEDRKVSYLHKIPGNFPGTPKSPTAVFPPTLMVSPRKETSVKLPVSIKPTQSGLADKKYTIASQVQSVRAQVAETSKKSTEGSDTGRMLYMGSYKKGGLGFARSSSNEPGNALKLKSSLKESMASPRKPYASNFTDALANKKSPTLTDKKSPTLTDTRKSDLLAQNVMTSPSGQGAPKKKGFGFLGLKFLSRNKN